MWYICIYIYHTHTHNGLLFSLKKEENCDTCCSMDEPLWNYTKLNTPETDYEYCMAHLYEVSRVIKLIETNNRVAVARSSGMGKCGIVV